MILKPVGRYEVDSLDWELFNALATCPTFFMTTVMHVQDNLNQRAALSSSRARSKKVLLVLYHDLLLIE